ncbi:GTPase family protein [Neisseria sp. 23W00296]|uniref:GTPase family protein n=1 Tax=unclassified Neisseria TaxID=2623750 RepID=UPI0002A2966C|nr:GTPase [Neisseria sp. oral taxon 020]EKY04226.1 hypothetical protein HMPREF9120_02361 [Neisseria sp. oral taxon 020 str. F0370]
MFNIFDVLENSEIQGLSKSQLRELTNRLRSTKVNVLLVGGTGVGKSSTINGLFKDNRAPVGQGAEPETAELKAYKWDNLIIWDTPGFGDSAANDRRYKEQIEKKLHEKDENGQPLIDMVLLILDGASRDFSSAYTIIKDVISPNLAEADKNRLLVAINKADMANSGRGWDSENNRPTKKLETILQEKLESTRKRIQEDTGLNADMIYYVAGFKDGDETQQPYNMEKLLSHILTHLPLKKRAIVMQDVNQDESVFQDNDKDYQDEIKEKIEESLWENIKLFATDMGLKIIDSTKEVAEKTVDFAKDTVVAVLSSKEAREAAFNWAISLFKEKANKNNE